MNWRLKLSCFFIVVNLVCFASKTDSLVKFSDLNFQNDFERQTFKSFIELGQKTDIIDLFLTNFQKKDPFPSSQAHLQISSCITELAKETEGMTEAKKVKEIYKLVHKRFFKMYKLRNSFSDIFEKGEYNCVSASALYAIIFQKMDIPFQIIEAPQHVFLIAYPNTHKIFIESTSPTNGYLPVSDGQVQRFIKYMYESKLISKEEYDSSSPNDLFNKYYYANNGLSLLELAGIQYSNYTAYHLEDENHEQALTEIKKACFLIQNERNKYLLQSITSYLVANHNYKDKKDVNNLSILCRFNNNNKKEVSDEKIKYEFGRLLQEQLITNSDEAEFERSYNSINVNVNDSVLKNDLAFIYHYELARLGYQKQKNKEYEMLHLKAAYLVKPKHADLQSLIRAYFGLLVERSNGVNLIMNYMKEFTNQYDFLSSDPAFNSVKANCLLEVCYQHFMLQEIAKGEATRADFEKLADSNTDIKPTERFVEKTYSTVATYYFKKGNKAKTKEVLKKGISYAPENFGLKIRLSQVN